VNPNRPEEGRKTRSWNRPGTREADQLDGLCVKRSRQRSSGRRGPISNAYQPKDSKRWGGLQGETWFFGVEGLVWGALVSP